MAIKLGGECWCVDSWGKSQGTITGKQAKTIAMRRVSRRRLWSSIAEGLALSPGVPSLAKPEGGLLFRDRRDAGGKSQHLGGNA